MLVTLELLDSQQGLPVQSWDIAPGRVWQIGRSEEADVVIASPFVSRAHAYLQETPDGWELVGISDKGLFVGGERQETVPLADGVEFRLATKGPLLRFRQVAVDPHEETSATISFDEQRIPMLILDRKQLDEEVTEISGSDYFAGLKQMAERIQQQKAARERPQT
jgi:pSer/pThr/pTyr-binding forkhead associated (FHA) protein